MHRRLIELYTLHQRRILDLGTMERVEIRQLSAGIAQIAQCLQTLHHLLHGVGAQMVIIDIIQTIGIGTLVTLGPLLHIADCAH